MDNFLEEHGEILIYGIVSIIMIILICNVCQDKWRMLIPEYNNKQSKNSSDFIRKNFEKYPVIQSEDIIYVECMKQKFDFRKNVTARDCNGRDISSRLIMYGKVDMSKAGIYKIKCRVSDDRELSCTKYINVIVE